MLRLKTKIGEPEVKHLACLFRATTISFLCLLLENADKVGYTKYLFLANDLPVEEKSGDGLNLEADQFFDIGNALYNKGRM